MNANAEFLNYVYQNSQMGVDSLRELLEDVNDNQLREYLKGQLEGYEQFHERARQMLSDSGYDEKGLNAFEKLRTYLMVNMQTMMDCSASHIAKMLIQGSTMGITEAVQKIHQYEGEVEKDVQKLMVDLKEYEEKNVEKLKRFL